MRPASASEQPAAAKMAAMKSRKAAGAIWTSFGTGRGSGSVSLVRAFSLGDGRGLELTVARLLPPSGLDLEGKGAEPDLKAAGPWNGRAWDDSRETTLLGDGAYAAAAGLFVSNAAH